MTNDERWGPYPLILAGAALAMLSIFWVDVEWGAFALGSVLLVAAALRFAGYGGLLAPRKPRTDIATLGGFGLGLVAVALFLEYPELKERLLGLFG
ncbi:DUF3017 domain-containing protein [Thermoactinospora rubra]|uniref:DUF3017 domain-containing protein n=1 Tax=Thermoactinospora rubra TaxID=1088767 RepID=UPI000A0FD225|nr:DUF3017 domain-containing protein [Thermoactinospora rubra]